MDTTSNEGEFGTSKEYEEARLDYSRPQYQDLWAYVAFYVHVVVLFILGIACWVSYSNSSDTDSDTDSESDSDTVTWDVDDIDFSGVIASLVVACIVGVLFGLLWLQCIKKFAEQIIKYALILVIASWVLLALIQVANGSTTGAVIYILFALVFALYFWCVRSRIPFAGACLAISSSIVQSYPGVIWLSFAAVFMVFLWYCIWGTAVTGYALSVGESNTLISFLFFVSLFWGAQTSMNVSHTTTCGVAATWYFSSETKLDNPSRKAFKRTMTTSFGSVAFGSLLVAIIQAMKAMLKNEKNGGGVGACIALCLLRCLERMIRYFNKYAFCQCAIYGVDYLTAGKRTWALFERELMLALINDDLSGLALTCGCILGAVASCGAAVLVAMSMYTNDDDTLYHWLLGIIGFFLGYCVVAVILKVVASGVVALFVCFAEDPAALYQNRPEAYSRLSGLGNATIDSIIERHNVEGQTGQTGQTTGVPAQQQIYVTQQPVQGAPQQVIYVQQQQPVQYGQVPPQYQEQPHYQVQQQPPQYQGR